MKFMIFAACFLASMLANAQPKSGPPAPSKLSFEQVLSISIERSEEIQSKQSELRSSKALLTRSQMRFLPDLSLTGTYSETGAEAYRRTPGRTYGVQSNVNLFRFGSDYYAYRAADFSVDSGESELQSTLLTFEESIAVKILDVIARHQEAEIRTKLYGAQTEYVTVAEKRFNKGILPRQELEKVTIDARIAEARLKDAQLAEFQAMENLSVFAGDVQMSGEWPWLSHLKKISERGVKFDVRNHPQWKFLKNRAQAADYEARSVGANIWPSLDMSLAYQNIQTAAIEPGWQPQWAGTLTLTIPLFSRWENKTATTLAKERQVRAELNLQKSGRDLESTWKIAEREFRVQVESAVTRDQTLKVSRRLYEDNLRRFQAGRANANDLFNDQDRLYQTELLAVQGWYAVHVAYVKLCHSLGLLTGECRL